MGYTPPEKIEITSCGSVLELDQVLPKSNTRPIAMYVYKYTKSLENLGRVTSLTEEYITKQLKNYFREI